MIVQMDAALYEALQAVCQNGHDPTWLPQPLAKKLWYHLPNHLVIGDKLFFCKMSNNVKQMLEVPQKSNVLAILAIFHGSHFAGHVRGEVDTTTIIGILSLDKNVKRHNGVL